MRIEKLIHTFSQLYKSDIDVEKSKMDKIKSFQKGMIDLLKLVKTREYQYLMTEYLKHHGEGKGLEINKHITFYKEGFQIMDNYIRQQEDLYRLDSKIIFALLSQGLDEEQIMTLTEKAIKKKYESVIKKKKSFSA